MEYACPLCRQSANCVLPVSSVKKTKSSSPSSSSVDPTQLASSSLLIPTCPAKIWIEASIANKQFSAADGEPSLDINQMDLSIHEKILHLLKTRNVSGFFLVNFFHYILENSANLV